jgi:hypothetical protein
MIFAGWLMTVYNGFTVKEVNTYHHLHQPLNKKDYWGLGVIMRPKADSRLL